MFSEMTNMQRLLLVIVGALSVFIAVMTWMYQSSQKSAIGTKRTVELGLIVDDVSSYEEGSLKQGMLTQIKGVMSDSTVTNAEFDGIEEKYKTYLSVKSREKVEGAIKK